MDINIRQGETLQLTITDDDLTAVTVQLIAVDENDTVVIDEIANFATVDGKRTATISTNDTNLPVAEYDYMLVVVYEGDIIKKLPDADCEDCSLPKIKVCEGLTAEVS